MAASRFIRYNDTPPERCTLFFQSESHSFGEIISYLLFLSIILRASIARTSHAIHKSTDFTFFTDPVYKRRPTQLLYILLLLN